MFWNKNASDSEKYYRSQQLSILLAFFIFVGSYVGFAKLDSYLTRKSNNKRNASYITEASIDTSYYEWCINATDINTLVYFENNKAYLYEFDYNLFDAETGLYAAITPSGEYRYIPVVGTFSFDNHDEAYKYAYQMLGNDDDIVCVSYPNHSKKLVP